MSVPEQHSSTAGSALGFRLGVEPVSVCLGSGEIPGVPCPGIVSTGMGLVGICVPNPPPALGSAPLDHGDLCAKSSALGSAIPRNGSRGGTGRSWLWDLCAKPTLSPGLCLSGGGFKSLKGAGMVGNAGVKSESVKSEIPQ